MSDGLAGRGEVSTRAWLATRTAAGSRVGEASHPPGAGGVAFRPDDAGARHAAPSGVGRRVPSRAGPVAPRGWNRSFGRLGPARRTVFDAGPDESPAPDVSPVTEGTPAPAASVHTEREFA